MIRKVKEMPLRLARKATPHVRAALALARKATLHVRAALAPARKATLHVRAALALARKAALHVRAALAPVRRVVARLLDQEPAVRRLLAAAGGGTQAQPCMTGTRMDTGLWFRQGRVWVACAPAGLVLVAPGRRPCVHRIPFTQLGESMYNAVTGEVLLLPAPEAAVRRLRMDPDAGRRLVEAIIKKGET